MLNKKKIISLLAATTILVGAFGFSSYGASVSKTLQAYYGTSRIIIDGQDVTQKIDPFIVNGTTYIPLRVVAETFNKNVKWDSTTATATITDDLTQVNEYYQAEILKRDIRIMDLESKLQKLEKELESNKEMTLSDLEKQLNKDYDEYRDIEFDITLSGTTSKVKVKIEVDLYDFDKEWNSLTDSRKTTYIQNIVDDILEAYPKASVEGYIRDIDAKKDILDFTVNKSGKVSITSKSSSSGTLADLEDYLNDEHKNYFKSEDIYFSIELEGNKNEITFYVDLDNSTSSRNWNRLSNSEKKGFMKYIADDIAYDFDKADIEGFVYYGSEKLYSY